MNLSKEIVDNICYLYNYVGDISMLTYLEQLDLKDKKARDLIAKSIKLNCNDLDSDIYYETRNELLYYLGFDFDDELVYDGSNLEDNDCQYIAFVLGRDLLKNVLPYENDLAYDFCKKVAQDFKDSVYNVGYRGLYECLEDYVKDNFYLNNGEITWKGEKI